MLAVDTNLLVDAANAESTRHSAARGVLVDLAEGHVPWALPWPCAHEFLRIVTHPRVLDPPLPLDLARAGLHSLCASPTVVLLSETARHAKVLDALLDASPATGNLLFDAHIAALCIEHGVSTLLTGDADFHRFGGLRVVDPVRESDWRV